MDNIGSTLAFIDKAIIIGYVVGCLLMGVLMTKMASKGMEDYFLGGRSIPWWVLGASGTASNLDMTGTMVIVSVMFSMGLKGFWITMRGGAGIPLAFLMVFLGKWLRRSKVMTSAEWMKLRFGNDENGKAAHILSAVANLVFCVGMVIYFSVGTGKFLAVYLPWNKFICSLIMITIGLTYTLMSGLYGVVFTDVIQEIMITFTAIYISVKAFFALPTVMASGQLTKQWMDFSLPFSSADPTITATGKAFLDKSHYDFFMFCVVFWVMKGFLEGMGGLGGYMAQRYYAAKNEREAGLLTAEWIVLLVFRWFLIASLAVLGLWIMAEGTKSGATKAAATAAAELTKDPEKVLPFVLMLLPAGIKGIAISGLIAAAMSTFDSTINAGASYFVKDIYQAYIKPEASEKELMKMSYMGTFGIAAIGVILGAIIPRIDMIWTFVTMALGAGMFMPLVLRWYWWRYTGYAFAIGTGTGIISATIIELGTSWALYVKFPVILLLSTTASIIATFYTKPASPKTLYIFYRTIKPGGLWGAISKYIEPNEQMKITLEHLNDIIALILGFPFQMALFFGAMCFIIHDWQKVAVCGIIVLFTSVGLYFFWYKNMKSYEECDKEDEEEAQILADANALFPEEASLENTVTAKA